MDSPSDLPMADQLWLDDVCNRFEAAWLAGVTPRIEDYLTELEGRRRAILGRELIRMDAHFRSQNGEAVSPAEYRRRFPDLGEMIAELGITESPPSDDDSTRDYRPLDDDEIREGIPAWDVPGAIPHYSFVRELGRGGMGVVWLGIHRPTGKRMAVKRIHPARKLNDAAVNRFLREARILEELDHPYIVPFYETGATQDGVYLAMEYVPGTDAGRMLKKHGPFSVRMAVRIISQVLQALEYAHAKGFVHRDVKPSNLLLQKLPGKRRVRVSDFGLARTYHTSTDTGITGSSDIGGTVPFMPPEQITDFHNALPSVDQYAAAATLYALLTDAFPHDLPEDVADQLDVIRREQPVPIRARRKDVPPRLAEAIHRGLARDPAARFPTVRAFRRALVEFLD